MPRKTLVLLAVAGVAVYLLTRPKKAPSVVERSSALTKTAGGAATPSPAAPGVEWWMWAVSPIAAAALNSTVRE